MGISAKIIADSIAKDTRKRLTTMTVRLPRYILAELNTHRMFSRNSASSRAIPVKKMIEQVKLDPVIPNRWGKNQPGMVAQEELTGETLQAAKDRWLRARDSAVEHAEALVELGLHKEVSNRILESWMWTVSIITATEWGNFYNLRCHPAAQPEMRVLAEAMWAAQDASIPRELDEGDWHLPYVTEDDKEALMDMHDDAFFKNEVPYPRFVKNHEFYLQKLSVARCARVSYLNHDGTTPNYAKNIELHDRLLKDGHASPFEHQATPSPSHSLVPPGNLLGFTQYRKLLPNENRTEYKR